MKSKAMLIYRLKSISDDGLIEIVIWRVPVPVIPALHRYKYRLVYLRDGQRVVGFDNERFKGDHCHLDGVELPYQFSNVHQLLEDFIREVDKRRQP